MYGKHPNVKDGEWAYCVFREHITGKLHKIVTSPYNIDSMVTSMNFQPRAELTSVTGLKVAPLYPGGPYRMDGSDYVEYELLNRKLVIATEHIPKLLFLHASEKISIGSVYSGLPTAHFCLVVPDNMMAQLGQFLKGREQEGMKARRLLSAQLNATNQQP